MKPIMEQEGGNGLVMHAAENTAEIDWDAWDAHHTHNRRRLFVLVCCSMAGILAVWMFSVADVVNGVSASRQTEAIHARESFMERFASYRRTMNAFSEPAKSGAAVKPQDGAFLESLKTRAVEAATSAEAPAGENP